MPTGTLTGSSTVTSNLYRYLQVAVQSLGLGGTQDLRRCLQELPVHRGRQLWGQIMSVCHEQVSPERCENRGGLRNCPGHREGVSTRGM